VDDDADDDCGGGPLLRAMCRVTLRYNLARKCFGKVDGEKDSESGSFLYIGSNLTLS
jgi:hypothetical protein